MEKYKLYRALKGGVWNYLQCKCCWRTHWSQKVNRAGMSWTSTEDNNYEVLSTEDYREANQ